MSEEPSTLKALLQRSVAGAKAEKFGLPGSTSVQADPTLVDYISTLSSASSTGTEKNGAAEQIKQMCIGDESRGSMNKAIQNAAVEMGAARLLLQLAKSSQAAAFSALFQICYSNEKSCMALVDEGGFSDTVRNVIHDKDDQAQYEAIACIAILVSSAPMTLPHVMQHLNRIIELLVATETSDKLKGQIVLLLKSLSTESEGRKACVDANAVPPLVDVMKSQKMEWFYVHASMTVANLVGHEESEVSKLAEAANLELIQHVLALFKASVEGKEYPKGSGVVSTAWKVRQEFSFEPQLILRCGQAAKSISNLAKSDGNKALFMKTEVIVFLYTSIVSAMDCEDPKLAQYAMLAARNLAFDDFFTKCIQDNSQFMELLDTLSAIPDPAWAGACEQANGLLGMWNLKRVARNYARSWSATTFKGDTADADEAGSKGHDVMLSYCWDNQVEASRFLATRLSILSIDFVTFRSQCRSSC
jgi:hypothetical protein